MHPYFIAESWEGGILLCYTFRDDLETLFDRDKAVIGTGSKQFDHHRNMHPFPTSRQVLPSDL